MTRPSAIRPALLLSLLLGAVAHAQSPAAPTGIGNSPTAPASVFRLLAGCWSLQKGDEKTEEQWLAPASNGLIGMARTLKGGRAIEQEFMRLKRSEDGHWQFIATLPGQPETAFALTSLTHMRVPGSYLARFENPDHDFPKVITYRQPSRNVLLAAIEGSLDGKPLRVEYAYARVACLK